MRCLPQLVDHNITSTPQVQEQHGREVVIKHNLCGVAHHQAGDQKVSDFRFWTISDFGPKLLNQYRLSKDTLKLHKENHLKLFSLY